VCSFFFFFSSRRRHTRFSRDWSSDVCSSDLFHRRGGGSGILARGPGQVLRSADAGDDVLALGLDQPFAVVGLLARRGIASEGDRSEERRVGKEWRCWGSPEHWRDNDDEKVPE